MALLESPAFSCTGTQQDSGLRRYIRHIHFAAGFMLPVAKLTPNCMCIQ